MKYKVEDYVTFFVDVSRLDPVLGEIIEVNEEEGSYMILYEGSKFKVHKRFVIEKIACGFDTLNMIISKMLYYKEENKKLKEIIEDRDDEISKLKREICDYRGFKKHIELIRQPGPRCSLRSVD